MPPAIPMVLSMMQSFLPLLLNNAEAAASGSAVSGTDMNEALKLKAVSSFAPSIISGVTSIANSAINRAQFKENREYNSPAHRMAMMLNAGINPNAAAQGIAGSSPEQPFVPSAAADFDSSSLSQLLGNFSDSYYNDTMKRQEIALMKAQTKNTDIDSLLKQIEVRYRPEIHDAALRKCEDDHLISEQNLELLKNEVAFAEAISTETLANLKLTGDVLRSQNKVLLSEKHLNYQKIKESKAVESNQYAQADKASAETIESVMRSGLIAEEIIGQDIQNELAKVDLQYNQKIMELFTSLGFPPEAAPLLAHYLTLDDAEAKAFLKDMDTYNYESNKYTRKLAVQQSYLTLPATMSNNLATGAGVVLGARLGRGKASPIGFTR